jgi:hypothetical protein
VPPIKAHKTVMGMRKQYLNVKIETNRSSLAWNLLMRKINSRAQVSTIALSKINRRVSRRVSRKILKAIILTPKTSKLTQLTAKRMVPTREITL